MYVALPTKTHPGGKGGLCEMRQEVQCRSIAFNGAETPGPNETVDDCDRSLGDTQRHLNAKVRPSGQLKLMRTPPQHSLNATGSHTMPHIGSQRAKLKTKRAVMTGVSNAPSI